METWAWLLAYVVAFGLLQLVLFRYFQRDEPAAEATPSAADRAVRSHADGGPDDFDDDVVRCRHCGTANERFATFAFCRFCVRPLS